MKVRRGECQTWNLPWQGKSPEMHGRAAISIAENLLPEHHSTVKIFCPSVCPRADHDCVYGDLLYSVSSTKFLEVPFLFAFTFSFLYALIA